MPRFHLPRSSYEFSVWIFPTTFRRWLRRMWGVVRVLALAFVDVLSQNRTEIVGKLYGNRRVSAHFQWKSYGVHAMSVRSRYDFWLSPCGLYTIVVRFFFLFPNYHKKSCGVRTIIAGSPYVARTTYLRATVLQFFKICKSADFYKIVEATEIAGSRRIVGTP